MDEHRLAVDDVRYLVKASFSTYDQDALDGFMLNVSMYLASEGTQRVLDFYFHSDTGIRPVEIDPVRLGEDTFRLEGGSQSLKYLGYPLLKLILTGVIEVVLLK